MEYIVKSIEKLQIKAWDTMDFTECEKAENKIKFLLMELSRQLRAKQIDCLYYESENLTTLWTRSLKQEDTIQVTTFLNKNENLIAMSDYQVQSYDDLFRENDIWHGATLYTL